MRCTMLDKALYDLAIIAVALVAVCLVLFVAYLIICSARGAFQGFHSVVGKDLPWCFRELFHGQPMTDDVWHRMRVVIVVTARMTFVHMLALAAIAWIIYRPAAVVTGSAACAQYAFLSVALAVRGHRSAVRGGAGDRLWPIRPPEE